MTANNFSRALFTLAAFALLATTTEKGCAAEARAQIGVVNFKQCVENSKFGKQEQASFEALKKQAEQVLQEKERVLTEIGNKLSDADYLDGISQEAEAELKHKYRMIGQELQQQQQQLYQTLSQANFKIVQKLTEEVNKAADNVAEAMHLDFIINEDACFFYTLKLDVTEQVIKVIDNAFEKAKE